MSTSHANCDHEKNWAPAYRACRKRRAARLEQARALVKYFDEGHRDGLGDWLAKGAYRFHMGDGAPHIPTSNRVALALALLDYFDPQLDEARLARRKADGYVVTAEPSVIRSTILRAFS